MKKLVFFTGAGVSKESGVETFRDSKDGLWNNYKIDEVATPNGWRNDREKVLRFYNERRRQMPTVEPNAAHKAIAELEKYYDVTVVTQNVDDLHERGGSTKILHLHGELTKARGCMYHNGMNPVDIGYNDINIGDKCKISDSQLRPHIVWFGEMPFMVGEANDAIMDADILVIVGTSLQISYTLELLSNVKRIPEQTKIYYIDPSPMRYLEAYNLKVDYIKKGAVEGMAELLTELTDDV